MIAPATRRSTAYEGRLINPRFYHLDTALCAVDQTTALFYPRAFDADGIRLIRKYFPNAIEVSDADAERFACNAVALGRIVVLQRGSVAVYQTLRERDFQDDGLLTPCRRMLTHDRL